MITISKKEFLSSKKKVFYNVRFEKMDLSHKNLSNIKFIYCDLSQVAFDYCNLENSSFENSLLDGTSLKYAVLTKANLKSTSMRKCNLEGACIKGAYLYSAVLELANIKDIIYDDTTKWFEQICPKEGAFIAYKKCIDDRLVTLYVPKDALRTSSTLEACRTNKAKVLRITNFDETKKFNEAWSFVDDSFCYKVGEWLEIKNFNKDRWFDSTTGIHFWMTKEHAIKY